MSFKDRRFSNFDAFNSVLKSGEFKNETDRNNDGLNNLNLRMISSSPRINVIEKLDSSKRADENEANFEEINLSMAEPYPRRQPDDILEYSSP